MSTTPPHSHHHKHPHTGGSRRHHRHKHGSRSRMRRSLSLPGDISCRPSAPRNTSQFLMNRRTYQREDPQSLFGKLNADHGSMDTLFALSTPQAPSPDWNGNKGPQVSPLAIQPSVSPDPSMDSAEHISPSRKRCFSSFNQINRATSHSTTSGPAEPSPKKTHVSFFPAPTPVHHLEPSTSDEYDASSTVSMEMDDVSVDDDCNLDVDVNQDCLDHPTVHLARDLQSLMHLSPKMSKSAPGPRPSFHYHMNIDADPLNL